MSVAVLLEGLKHVRGMRNFISQVQVRCLAILILILGVRLMRPRPFRPASPYGAAKALECYWTRIYREAYGMFTVCGMLFNHESELRGA